MNSAVVALVGILGVCIVLGGLRELRASSDSAMLTLLPIGSLVLFAVLAETPYLQGNVYRVGITAFVLASSALAMLSKSRPSPHVNIPPTRLPTIAVLTALTIFSLNVVLVEDISATQVFGRLLPCLVWASIGILVSTTYVPVRGVLSLLLIAFGLACALTPLSPEPFTPCSQFKCGPFGELLAGPFTSENFFARIACVAFLTSLTLGRSKLAALSIVCSLLVLYATASRTSQLALALALVAWAIWNTGIIRRLGFRPVVAMILPAVALLVGVHLVYTANQYTFSNRGYIWILGRTALGNDLLTGRGIDTWAAHVLERNFMHSQALLLLYSGGVVAIALYGAMLYVAIRRLPSPGGGFGFAIVVLILVLGLAEIVWNPVALDGSAFFLVVMMMLHLPTESLTSRAAPNAATVSAVARRPPRPDNSGRISGRDG